MQQGMLSSVLLVVSLVFCVFSVSATEMQSERIQQWLKDEQIQSKVSDLLQYAVHDEVESLNFSLQRLALPQQEVARFLLLESIEQNNLILSPKMAMFVESQQAMVPTYYMLERGEGYEFSVPAFNYPAIASRLTKQWRQDQQTMAFVLAAEREELSMQEWFKGSEYQVQTREELFVRELNSLSPKAVSYLSAQLTSAAVTSWLPSTQVMVKLAQVNGDAEVYKLLWLMRADHHSQAELSRLALAGDEFSLQQVMLAANNPSLKTLAYTQLSKIDPMPSTVKEYLIAKMQISDDAPIIARELAQHGHSNWLRDLAETNQSVKSRLILQAISQ